MKEEIIPIGGVTVGKQLYDGVTGLLIKQNAELRKEIITQDRWLKFFLGTIAILALLLGISLTALVWIVFFRRTL